MSEYVGGEDESRYELREIQTLEGHKDRVWGVAWNPTNSDTLATCSGDKTVRIWHRSDPNSPFLCKTHKWIPRRETKLTNDPLHRKDVLETHSRTVRSCSWSPCGKLLATASFDATSSIWEQVGDDFECLCSIEGHENEVKSVSWNASGSLLATCSRDKTVWITELLPGGEHDTVAVLNGHSQDVKMVQWHPSVDILFSCSYDNTIKVWAGDEDTDDWHCVQTLSESNNGHSSTVWALSFNAEGDKMVTCSDDLSVKIWTTDLSRLQSGDVNTPWKHLCTLSGYHDRTIFSVHFSRDGIIATGAADNCIRLFVENKDGLVDGPMYKLLLKKNKAHDMDVNSVRWSFKDDRLLASASDDGTIKIWQLNTPDLY